MARELLNRKTVVKGPDAIEIFTRMPFAVMSDLMRIQPGPKYQEGSLFAMQSEKVRRGYLKQFASYFQSLDHISRQSQNKRIVAVIFNTSKLLEKNTLSIQFVYEGEKMPSNSWIRPILRIENIAPNPEFRLFPWVSRVVDSGETTLDQLVESHQEKVLKKLK